MALTAETVAAALDEATAIRDELETLGARAVANANSRHRERRQRVLRLSPIVLFALLQKPDERVRLTSTGMPDDARFVAAYYDDLMQMFRVHVESDSFDPVPEGHIPPDFTVTFSVEYDEPAGEAN